MASGERPVERAQRIADEDRVRVGWDLRQARIANGLSLRAVERAAGISRSQLSRIERGLAPEVANVRLVLIGAVVGLDVRTRTYPGLEPLRDVGHTRLLGRLRARLPPGVTFRTEIPLPIPGDLCAWDAVIAGLASPPDGPRAMPVEAETRFHDAQAQLRRLEQKCRDGGFDQVILLLADTPANRRAVEAARGVLSDRFTVSPRRALAALAAGAHPVGSALILL